MTVTGSESPVKLRSGLGLLGATATNINTMVGVGPFMTIPFMIVAMNGPHVIYAWLAGGILALADGLVYAQLGAAIPGSGGPYLYLREAFKPFGLGRLMAFIFIFQIILVAPLSIAGGAVGFGLYLKFYWTAMTPLQQSLIAAAVCVCTTALLYRDIESVGRLEIMMLWVVIGTVLWVIVAGLFNFSPAQAFSFPNYAYRLDGDLVRRIGATSILAMYSYGGYNQVCNIAEEVHNPTKNIPRSIVLSILVVAALYMMMTTVIVGMVPWQEAARTQTIASIFIERTFLSPEAGRLAGLVMTGLILFVAVASLYAVILGYSRIPFAAARDGDFFKVFARVHPKKGFPHVSLLVLSAISIPFCFFTLDVLVNWLIQVQILLRFIWQCIGVMLLYHYRKDIAQPFRMWLYPLPALLSLALWIYIFWTGDAGGIVFSFAFLTASVAAYFVFVRVRGHAGDGPGGRSSSASTSNT